MRNTCNSGGHHGTPAPQHGLDVSPPCAAWLSRLTLTGWRDLVGAGHGPAVRMRHCSDASPAALGRILSMRGRIGRLARQGARTMHPDIIKALMDERGRERQVEARQENRVRRLLRGRTR